MWLTACVATSIVVSPRVVGSALASAGQMCRGRVVGSVASPVGFPPALGEPPATHRHWGGDSSATALAGRDTTIHSSSLSSSKHSPLGHAGRRHAKSSSLWPLLLSTKFSGALVLLHLRKLVSVFYTIQQRFCPSQISVFFRFITRFYPYR